MQAAVEGTLGLVEAVQIPCGFCGGNLEYVEDYRGGCAGGIWKATQHGSEIASAAEKVVAR